ncbi:hypothetical protein [Streptomyces flaveolus]
MTTETEATESNETVYDAELVDDMVRSATSSRTTAIWSTQPA